MLEKIPQQKILQHKSRSTWAYDLGRGKIICIYCKYGVELTKETLEAWKSPCKKCVYDRGWKRTSYFVLGLLLVYVAFQIF